jgi:lipopolysaccharide export LptBFGC system permease protein LptF
MNNTIKTLVFACLIFIVNLSGAAQTINKNALTNMWKLDTYMINGKNYTPSKKEKNDFICFNDDMTFVLKSEGKEEKGTYMINTNGAYIEMIDNNNERLKAYIILITKEKLVLVFNIKELREVEVHYKISK